MALLTLVKLVTLVKSVPFVKLVTLVKLFTLGRPRWPPPAGARPPRASRIGGGALCAAAADGHGGRDGYEGKAGAGRGRGRRRCRRGGKQHSSVELAAARAGERRRLRRPAG
eukprot:308663-Chlamydomonas_euryale.AAC.1